MMQKAEYLIAPSRRSIRGDPTVTVGSTRGRTTLRFSPYRISLRNWLVASGLHRWRSGKEGSMLGCQTLLPLLFVGVFAIWLLVRLEQLKKQIARLLSRQLTLEPVWFYSRCLIGVSQMKSTAAFQLEKKLMYITLLNPTAKSWQSNFYKTSVLVFKDRDRYVQGDYMFRYGYCKHKHASHGAFDYSTLYR